MKVTILGSGSSSGVPALDVGWGACDAAEPGKLGVVGDEAVAHVGACEKDVV